MSLKCSNGWPGEFSCWYSYAGVDHLVGGFKIFNREDGVFRVKLRLHITGPTLSDHYHMERWVYKEPGKGEFLSEDEAKWAALPIFAKLFQEADGHGRIVQYAAARNESRRASLEEWAGF